jgi:hypothetical protein
MRTRTQLSRHHNSYAIPFGLCFLDKCYQTTSCWLSLDVHYTQLRFETNFRPLLCIVAAFYIKTGFLCQVVGQNQKYWNLKFIAIVEKARKIAWEKIIWSSRKKKLGTSNRTKKSFHAVIITILTNRPRGCPSFFDFNSFSLPVFTQLLLIVLEFLDLSFVQ